MVNPLVRIVSLLIGVALAGGACTRWGLTNRVLLRVASPDGQLIAVCQEIPELDGPGYDVRLEHPDGSLAVRLYRIGDGDSCSEIAWAPEGSRLAVLSSHVARIRFVDVTRALGSGVTGSAKAWEWPQLDLASEADLQYGRALRFSTPRDVELITCPYSLRERQDSGHVRCTAREMLRHARVPL
jgi:hypothetical protein